MQDDIRTVLALQQAPASPKFMKLPEGARVKDLGIEYIVLYCDRNGAALRRMDETNATIGFTQVELDERLNRKENPMTVEFGFYSENKAKARNRGAPSLSVLAPKDQEDVLRKEFVVRKFLELRSENKEQRRLARIDGLPLPPSVSKSRESLLRVIPIIARAWRELQISSGSAWSNRKPTSTGRVNYTTKAKVELWEPSPSSVKDWIIALEENQFDATCLKNKYRSERPEYFTPDEFQYLNDAIRSACSTTKPDLAQIYKDMAGQMENANKLRPPEDQLRIPCEDTLRNRFNARPEMWRELGRDGREAARKEWQPEHGGIDVIRALERIECDDHEIDLQTLLVKVGIWQTLSKAERKKIKRIRLWITAMICVATRCIIALHVSAEAPSLKSAMTALEMSTRDKTDIARRLGCQSRWMQHGTGEVIAVDSAVYFAHRPFRVAVNDMGCAVFLPPAGEASMRGFIERWFQTCSHQMFNYFDGRTWGSIAEKGDYDSDAHAAAVADLVGECLIRWGVDGYHNAPHTGLNGATPYNRWIELARDHGVQPGPTGALRTHLFGTYVKRVISKKGYRVAGLYFQSKELQQMRRQSKKTPVLGRVNNHNLDAVSILTENGWIEVPCVHRELAGVSIWQWLAAVERLRLFNSENAKASRQILVDTFAWLKQQAEMARLEAGLVNPVLTDEDYQRFERKMDRDFDLTDAPSKGEPRPEGDWRPSDELFAALRISPIVYAKTRSAKVIREEAETGGRPALGTPLALLRPQEPTPEDDANGDETVIHRISNNIFDDE